MRGRLMIAAIAVGVAVVPWTATSASASTARDLAAPAATVAYDAVVDTWSMTVVNGGVPGSGSASMSLYGNWQQVQGNVGSAVQFNSATSYGVADGTAGRNPGKLNAALGAVFRSNPIPAGGYSGNLIQKGLWGDSGQMKVQVVPDGGGTVECRIKGSSKAKFIGSSIVVDDGQWHTAVCWREGGKLGLTVDGVTRSITASVGSIVNSRPLHVANKNESANWSDQLIGAVDCAALATGTDARPAALAALSC
jgi:hypothetical protein